MLVSMPRSSVAVKHTMMGGTYVTTIKLRALTGLQTWAKSTDQSLIHLSHVMVRLTGWRAVATC